MRRIFTRPNGGQVDEGNPYWISFSDIMSGLLIIFVMASLALILELTKMVDMAESEILHSERIRRQIVHEVADSLRTKGIHVEVSDNETVVHIPESVLAFESDKHSIPTESKEDALEIGRVLYNAIVHDNRWQSVDTVFIEGHTDELPSRRPRGNWGLSTDRAIELWKYWNDTLPELARPSELRNHSGAPLFSVSGYGQTRPLPGDQITDQDRRKNRRIDIRFTVLSPSIEKLSSLKTRLGR